jgi:hypothetical protein
VRRHGNSRVIVGGFLLAIVAYGLFLPVGPDWSYAAMFPSLVIAGIAFAWPTAHAPSRRPTTCPRRSRAGPVRRQARAHLAPGGTKHRDPPVSSRPV